MSQKYLLLCVVHFCLSLLLSMMMTADSHGGWCTRCGGIFIVPTDIRLQTQAASTDSHGNSVCPYLCVFLEKKELPTLILLCSALL